MAQSNNFSSSCGIGAVSLLPPYAHPRPTMAPFHYAGEAVLSNILLIGKFSTTHSMGVWLLRACTTYFSPVDVPGDGPCDGRRKMRLCSSPPRLIKLPHVHREVISRVFALKFYSSRENSPVGDSLGWDLTETSSSRRSFLRGGAGFARTMGERDLLGGQAERMHK